MSSTSLGFAPSGKPAIEVTNPAKKIPTPEIAFPEKPTVAKNRPSDLLLVATQNLLQYQLSWTILKLLMLLLS